LPWHSGTGGDAFVEHELGTVLIGVLQNHQFGTDDRLAVFAAHFNPSFHRTVHRDSQVSGGCGGERESRRFSNVTFR